MKMKEDENRRLNQALEDAVQGLQKAPTQEQLAHTLTVVRRVMQAGGQWIAALVKKSRKSRYSVSQCFQHTCHVIDLRGKLCL